MLKRNAKSWSENEAKRSEKTDKVIVVSILSNTCLFIYFIAFHGFRSIRKYIRIRFRWINNSWETNTNSFINCVHIYIEHCATEIESKPNVTVLSIYGYGGKIEKPRSCFDVLMVQVWACCLTFSRSFTHLSGKSLKVTWIIALQSN